MERDCDSQESELLRSDVHEEAAAQDEDPLGAMDIDKHVINPYEPRELIWQESPASTNHRAFALVAIAAVGSLFLVASMIAHYQRGPMVALKESHEMTSRVAYDFVGEGNCKPNRPQWWASEVQYGQCQRTCDTASRCIGFDWDSRWTFCRVRFATNLDVASPPPGFQAMPGMEGGRLARAAGIGAIQGIEGSHTAGCFQKADKVPFERFLSNPDAFGIVGPLPTILDYYEETGLLSERQHAAKQLHARQDGLLEYSGSEGEMILPSLDAAPLLKFLHQEHFEFITLVVGVNSDSYNYGLGVVIEASPQINETQEHGASYMYNGYGVHRNRNVIKFHPGYRGGQLRVEGPGGFPDMDVGFTPPAFTAAQSNLNHLEITVRPDGNNEIVLKSAVGEYTWRGSWRHRLFDGRDVPALYAFIDLGGEAHKPLVVGHVSLKIRRLFVDGP